MIVVYIPGGSEGRTWRLVREDSTACGVRGCRMPVAQTSFDLSREDGEGWAFSMHGSGYCGRHARHAIYASVGVSLAPHQARELGAALPAALRRVCGDDDTLYEAAWRTLAGHASADNDAGDGEAQALAS